MKLVISEASLSSPCQNYYVHCFQVFRMLTFFCNLILFLCLKARSHRTPGLNYLLKVLNIWWTWSKVEHFGKIWRGCVRCLAVPLLQHCGFTTCCARGCTRAKILRSSKHFAASDAVPDSPASYHVYKSTWARLKLDINANHVVCFMEDFLRLLVVI